ncbi:hypothetical protein BU23DRAFT_628973, partial [Bimuria novae-zelandiae CBS 107.79]
IIIPYRTQASYLTHRHKRPRLDTESDPSAGPSELQNVPQSSSRHHPTRSTGRPGQTLTLEERDRLNALGGYLYCRDVTHKKAYCPKLRAKQMRDVASPPPRSATRRLLPFHDLLTYVARRERREKAIKAFDDWYVGVLTRGAISSASDFPLPLPSATLSQTTTKLRLMLT